MSRFPLLATTIFVQTLMFAEVGISIDRIVALKQEARRILKERGAEYEEATQNIEGYLQAARFEDVLARRRALAARIERLVNNR